MFHYGGDYINTNVIIHGDCLDKHKKIKSGSVDLILTDPPYGTVKEIGNSDRVKHGMQNKTSWDNAINPSDIYNISNKLLRVNGKLILFSQEPYTNELINKAINNLPFNYKMIWLKDHFANSLIAKKAPVNYYEDILVFSKENDIDNLHPLREYFKKVKEFIGKSKVEIMDIIGQRADHTFRTTSTQFSLCTKETYQELVNIFEINKMEGFKTYKELRRIDKNYDSVFNLWKDNKYKGNVLEYKKDYDGYHPTQKPVALLEDLIKTFSNENDLIVDLTAGSGSTAVASVNTNRNYICIEKEKEYVEISRERLKKPSLFASAK